MKNDYYDIAYNDLLYLEDDYYKTNYNPMVVQIQQVAEKMLKSVLVLVSTNETLFHSHIFVRFMMLYMNSKVILC